MTTSPTRRRRGSAGGSPLTAYLFLAPYLLLFGVFVVLPAIYGFWMSLHDWDFTLEARPFICLLNYADLFDPLAVQFQPFWRGMSNTAIFTLASVPFLVAVPLGLAVLLNSAFPGRTFFRAVYFVPYVLGVAVIGVMWRYLLDGNFGLINAIFGVSIQWTTDQPWAWIALVGVTVWWTMGFNAIIYMVGLSDIPPHLYEAAALDGAGPWRRFIHVTLPGLRPVLIFIMVTTVLASANMFGQSYLITQGGPTESTMTAIMVITGVGFGQNRAGQAAAMSYLLAIALALVSVLNFWLMRDKDAAREAKDLKRQRKLDVKEGAL
ncbi:sugar ABC transporter permease [Tessaracoccus sp. MC1679]|uniref:carbohydrate ABC transporter permease n=1 Tax=Tessaracoccus sp. MC1679 TaxID=2760313 RepID=UPI00160079C0|nr:sugar ABC transporter permease [Tessaracoccus sp. MC1679]MBB1514461.1 sugar ABC transporter permease [Tessaracoccus sp. MC1679]